MLSSATLEFVLLPRAISAYIHTSNQLLGYIKNIVTDPHVTERCKLHK